MALTNKKNGSKFEVEFLNILKKYKFWARLDKGYSQTCDIIAGKNNKIYLFECKVCKTDYFNLTRVEANQNDSRDYFKHCGNDRAYFVYKVNDCIFLSKEPIRKPSEGISLEVWLNGEDN